jgi:hypothetical protein
MRSISSIAMAIALLAICVGATASTCADYGHKTLSAMISATTTPDGMCPPLHFPGEICKTILPRDTVGQTEFVSKGWVTGLFEAGETIVCDRTWDDPKEPSIHWFHGFHIQRCGNRADVTFYIVGQPERVEIKYRDKEVVRKIIVLREVTKEVVRSCTTTNVTTNNYTSTVVAMPAQMPMVTPMVTYGGMRYPGSYTSGPPVVLVGLSRSSWETRHKSQVCPPPITPPPPDNGNCPPGTPGVEPPPNGGTPGNPSGPIPCPPATDPNRPPDQPTHGTGGQTWDPGPDAPTVADPVN